MSLRSAVAALISLAATPACAQGPQFRLDRIATPADPGVNPLYPAGAMTALQSVLTGAPAERPSFIGYIHGPMLPVQPPAGAPPMFAALALDDPLFGKQGFGIVDSWRQAGSGIELHVYQKGDHGFGMGRPGTTTTLVMDEFRFGLDNNGFLKARP